MKKRKKTGRRQAHRKDTILICILTLLLLFSDIGHPWTRAAALDPSLIGEKTGMGQERKALETSNPARREKTSDLAQGKNSSKSPNPAKGKEAEKSPDSDKDKERCEGSNPAKGKEAEKNADSDKDKDPGKNSDFEKSKEPGKGHDPETSKEASESQGLEENKEFGENAGPGEEKEPGEDAHPAAGKDSAGNAGLDQTKDSSEKADLEKNKEPGENADPEQDKNTGESRDSEQDKNTGESRDANQDKNTSESRDADQDKNTGESLAPSKNKNQVGHDSTKNKGHGQSDNGEKDETGSNETGSNETGSNETGSDSEHPKMITDCRIKEEEIFTKDKKKWYAAYDEKKKEAHITFIVKTEPDCDCSLFLVAKEGDEVRECKAKKTGDHYQAVFSEAGTWIFSVRAEDQEGNQETAAVLALDSSGELEEIPPVVISGSRPELTVTYDGDPYKKDGESGNHIYYNKNQSQIELQLQDELEEGEDDRPNPKIRWELTPAQAEPAQTEPSQAEPAQTEPSQAEPAQTEPSQAESAQTEPAQTEPSQAESAQTESAQAESSQIGAVQAESSQGESTQTEPPFTDTGSGNTFARQYSLTEEGTYSFSINYQSKNGRRPLCKEKYRTGSSTLESGKDYQSKTVVVDHTAPSWQSLSLSEGDNRKISSGGKDYIFLNNPSCFAACLRFQILDSNLSPSSVKVSVAGTGVEWKSKESGDRLKDFETSFSIVDWKDLSDGSYQLELGKVSDKAGNVCSPGGSIKELLTKTWIIIDRISPIMHLTYPETEHSISDSGRGKEHAAELFYKEPVKIGMELAERNYFPEVGNQDRDFQIQILSKASDLEKDYNSLPGTVPVFDQGERGDLWKGVLADLPACDSHSLFYLSYTDFSGNVMTSVTDNLGCGMVAEDRSQYISPVVTVDQTAPVIRTTFSKEAVNRSGDRAFYRQPISLRIVVEDENFNCDSYTEEELSVSYTASDFDPATKKRGKEYFSPEFQEGDTWDRGTYVKGKKQYRARIPIREEANYDIRSLCQDMAGNKAHGLFDRICLDRTRPYMQVEDVENTAASDILFKSFSQDGRPGRPADFFDFKGFAYFFRKKLLLKVTAHDMVSGISAIEYTVKYKGGKQEKGIWHFSEPRGDQTRYLTIAANDRASLTLTPHDFSFNQGKEAVPRGAVTETGSYHKEHAGLQIKVKTKPSAIKGSLRFYNTPVEAVITMADRHSGLQKGKIRAGKAVEEEFDYGAQVGNVDKKGEPQEGIHYVRSFQVQLNAGDVNHSSQSNPSLIEAEFTDLSGNRSQVARKMVIDSKKPVIHVRWEGQILPANQKVYSGGRTAVIAVKERNFDPAAVKWNLKGSRLARIGSWRQRGDDHICKVVFAEDGDNYQLDFTVTDLAGNTASCPRQEMFSIDTAAPRISLSFDVGSSRNGHYYNRGRKATIEVREHNFRPQDVQSSLSFVSPEGKKKPLTLSAWENRGDVHRATVACDQEGDYKLKFTCTDPAGHKTAPVSSGSFTIDRTSPDVQVSGVSRHAAYPGKVAPQVKVSDKHLDPDQIEITLTGNKNGPVDYALTANDREGHSRLVSWRDFAHTEAVDDVYTLEITVTDKAGNTTHPLRTVFSVNRFGSNYILGKEISRVLAMDHPHLKEPVPVEITEVNVSGLREKGIRIRNENNEIIALQEGEDYQVAESDNRYAWRQYRYKIKRSVFEKEGQYWVTLTSLDHAQNQMTNLTKDLPVSFVIDRTRPSGAITGLEEKSYREKKHDIYVRADDNYGLKEAVLYINGQKKQKYTAQDFASGYSVKEVLEEKNIPQKATLRMQDWAGNQSVIVPEGNPGGALITTDPLIQLLHDKLAFYGLITVFLILLTGILVLMSGGSPIWKGKSLQRPESS